jgi:hypothetical protein
MNHLIFFLCALLFSLVCEASSIEEFEINLSTRLTKLNQSHEDIKLIAEEDYSSYRNKEVKKHNNLDAFKRFYGFCTETINNYSKDWPRKKTSISNEGELADHLFIKYCRTFNYIKELQNYKAQFLPESLGATYVSTALHAFNIFQDYFSEAARYLVDFLIIEPKKRGIDNIQTYQIRLNYFDVFFYQKRKAKNIMAIFERTDLEKLELPELYKQYLQRVTNVAKKSLKSLLTLNSRLVYNKYKDVANLDLAILNEDLTPFCLGEVHHNLDSMVIAYKPLELTFRPEGQSQAIELSEEQRAKSLPLLQEMLEIKIIDEQIKDRPIHIKKDIQNKKKKGKSNHKVQERQGTEKPSYPNTSSSTKSDYKQPPVTTTKVNDDSTKADTVKGIAEMKEESLSKEDDALKSSIPALTEDEGSNNDFDGTQEECNFLKNYLSLLMSKTYNKWGGYASLYQKASNLLDTLSKHPELLEQIQQGTHALAQILQGMEHKEINTVFTKLLVPERLDESFNYLMETPLCYLKGIRMNFITSLFRGLEIKVDTTRSGSRVHLEFKNHKTSFHVHDKNNGEIVSGAIASLRKYLLDIGWAVKDL